mmetsp:Transcript_28093/g.38637  ORF Transcript_28093/g.38637 Transcript_28093/m.38637 type:complete len:133 (-) Transcript_28093:34-432(-)
MLSNALIAVIASIVVFVLVSLMGIYCYWRQCCIRRTYTRSTSSKIGYDELDQEEIEFKRMIESHGGQPNEEDDDDEIFSSGMEDLSFNAKDKNRLTMLENLRSNLVAGVEADVINESQSDIDITDGDEELRL